MGTVEPIRNVEDIRKVENILAKQSLRNLVFFTIGTNCGLRISDILKLNVGDVKNRNFIQLTEKKTGKFKKFPINSKLKELFAIYTKGKRLDLPLFETKFGNRLARVAAYYIIRTACEEAGLEDKFGTHTMRKTFGYHHYKKFKDVAMLQKINNSDSFIIDVEDRAWPNTNIVLKKEYFYKIPNIQQFYKTDWIHLYILLFIAKNWQNCYLFSDKHPIIIDRVGVQTWLNNDDGPRIYYHNLWTYSFANKLGYSKKVFNWYRKKLLKEYIKNITYRRSQSFRVNFSYLLKYFPYWWDCWNFYLQFIPKFLDLKNEILSIRNYDSNRKKKSKTKIFKICFMEYKLAIKRSKKTKVLFMHNILPDEFITMYNEQGNFKQFVKNTVYKEMQDYVYNNEHLFKGKSKKFKNHILRMKNKKLIPYSWYLGDCWIMTKFLEKKGILKK